MREIKFRGYNGEKWLFGNLEIDYKAKHACISDNRFWRHPVRFDTVGQFTGLLDSNGKEIYEGDIVKVDGWRKPTLVEWFDANAQFVIDGSLNLGLRNSYMQVIGNIHDNPQLLKEGGGNA